MVDSVQRLNECFSLINQNIIFKQSLVFVSATDIEQSVLLTA